VKVSETQRETKLTSMVKKAGGLCIKLPAQLYRGIPDRLVLLPGGRVVFVELKRPSLPGQRGGKLSTSQSEFRKSLQLLGLRWYMIQDEADLERFKNDHLKI